jgi:hypothetical protein
MKKKKPFYKSKTFWIAMAGIAHGVYQIAVEKNTAVGFSSIGTAIGILTARFSEDTNTGKKD